MLCKSLLSVFLIETETASPTLTFSKQSAIIDSV